MIAFLLLVQISFLFWETTGFRIRPQICSSGNFVCGANCISKSKWCNGNYDCTDRTDEYYCSSSTTIGCNTTLYFRCKNNARCIPRKGRCDGYSSCTDNSDEKDCHFISAVKVSSETNLRNVISWISHQRDADWGWKGNSGRAMVALHLVESPDLERNSTEDDLMAKQLELEVSTHLLRNKDSKLSPTELSTYINALLVICHDPKNFFGFDLIQKLKEAIQEESGYMAPFPYLTLCNAKERVSSEAVGRLLQIVKKPPDYGFVLEVQALAIMALTCISKDDHYANLTNNITEALNNLKSEQRQDGSFGNEYTTALVFQAFIANNQTNEKDWNYTSSIRFLRGKQKSDGSFGDFLTTYLIMPIFEGRSLVDVGKVNCPENLRRPREGNLISDIHRRLGGKIPVKYSLVIGDEKDQIHPIFLRVPENITVFEVMSLAADIDPKYKFKTHEIKKKKYVYEVLNIPNDPENNKFWFLYRDVENKILPVSTQAPDEVRVQKDDNLVMWYRTLNSL